MALPPPLPLLLMLKGSLLLEGLPPSSAEHCTDEAPEHTLPFGGGSRL